MMPLLASAASADSDGSQLSAILVSLLVIGIVGVMIVIPIAVARRRLLRRAEAVTVVAILWGLLSAGSVIYFWLAELRWSQEYDSLIKTGYYDPQDLSGAPAWPWWQWILLAVTYGALIVYSRSRKCPPPSSSRQT